jgi:hypothetical protein
MALEQAICIAAVVPLLDPLVTRARAAVTSNVESVVTPSFGPVKV